MYGKGKNRKANSPLRGDCFLCFHFSYSVENQGVIEKQYYFQL